MSDYKGAALIIDAFPKAKALLDVRVLMTPNGSGTPWWSAVSPRSYRQRRTAKSRSPTVALFLVSGTGTKISRPPQGVATYPHPP